MYPHDDRHAHPCISFYYYQLLWQCILLFICAVLFVVPLRILLFHFFAVLMCIEFIILHLDYAGSNIRAVIGDTLVSIRDI